MQLRICKEKDLYGSIFQHVVLSATLNACLYSFCTNNLIMLISYTVQESAFHLVLQFVSCNVQKKTYHGYSS